VPPDVVPWKYMMPPVPPVADIVVLPQKVPPPDAVTAPGAAVTETTLVAKQPVELSVYVIVVVPVAMPPRTPVELSIVPLAVVLLLQVPPGVASVSVVVAATQTALAPPIAAGLELIVTAIAASGPQHPAEDCARK